MESLFSFFRRKSKNYITLRQTKQSAASTALRSSGTLAIHCVSPLLLARAARQCASLFCFRFVYLTWAPWNFFSSSLMSWSTEKQAERLQESGCSSFVRKEQSVSAIIGPLIAPPRSADHRAEPEPQLPPLKSSDQFLWTERFALSKSMHLFVPSLKRFFRQA